MSTEIMRRISYLPVLWRNPLKLVSELRERAMKRRFNAAMAQLVAEGNYEEARYLLRKRYTLTAMQDMNEVGQIVQGYMQDDPFMTSLVAPIVRAFSDGTARDIRNLGGH